MGIITNNVPRLLLYPNQLTEKEREQFDYLDWENIDAGNDSAEFFRYKGDLYEIGQFERTQENEDLALAGWQSFHPDSLWTATLVKYCDDTDYVIVGRYIA